MLGDLCVTTLNVTLVIAHALDFAAPFFVSEQWREVISRRYKQNVKKAYQASLLSEENGQNSSSKVAGHVMFGGMFSRAQNITKEICGSEW